jgi:hypothetical protein
MKLKYLLFSTIIEIIPTLHRLKDEYGGRVRLLLGFMPIVILTEPDDIQVLSQLFTISDKDCAL